MKNLILLSCLFLLSSCYTTQQIPPLGASYPIELTNANFQFEIVESKNVSVVYFWAVWCGPCKTTGPIFKELAETEIGNTIYGKVNVDESPEISSKYAITNLPTVIVLKNGKVVDRYIGTFSKEIVGNMVTKAY